jgi:prepilin-type N-terminal cleavage/methylation domain-containing protein
MKKSKGFTLIEILISISIFSIVVVFLYQTLDMTQKSNDFYSEKLEDKQNQNYLKKIFFLDLMHKQGAEKIIKDREENSIFSFKSTNTYHNPFYEHITYMISKEKNFLRIESKKEINTKRLDEDFFKNSFIDVIDNNITKFKVKTQKDKKVVFYLLKDNKQKMIFAF